MERMNWTTARQAAEFEAEMKQKRDMEPRPDCAMRELTVGELLDRKIEKAERQLHALHDLKGSLPANFLNCGSSRLAPLSEL